MVESSEPHKFSVYVSTGRPWDWSPNHSVDEGYWVLDLTDEAFSMWTAWADVEISRDGPMSGVFADWIEDHPEHFTGLYTDKALPKLIEYLRTAFELPERNRSGYDERFD